MATIARPHVPEEELHEYCDGGLSPAQRMEIAEHLLACLICRAQRAEVEALILRASALLAVASPRPAARGAAAPVRHRLARLQGSRIMAAAAVAIIGVGIVFAVQPSSTPPGRTQLAMALGRADFFQLGRAHIDQAAIRARQLTMADRITAPAQIQSGPATPGFVPPVAIGQATEVDPVATSEWTVATVDDALRVADGKLAHIPGIPVKLVRVHNGTTGGRPTLLIRQELADGRAIWVLEGLERDIAPVDQVLQASGISMSMATRTRPDYVAAGPELAVTVRMVRVVGYLPVDSLNALAQKLASK